ncbi:hypothetical protein J6590_055736 [Homalodisca vitripennis]|nr:hypothetical protein J6590_055736 [Homalodisca vitripennis]
MSGDAWSSLEMMAALQPCCQLSRDTGRCLEMQATLDPIVTKDSSPRHPMPPLDSKDILPRCDRDVIGYCAEVALECCLVFDQCQTNHQT